MSIDENHIKYGAVGAGVLVLLFLLMRNRDLMVASAMAPDDNPAVPGAAIQSPGFASNINVDVNPSLISMLDQRYVPLFGFVGTKNIGTINTEVKLTQLQSPTPILPAIAQYVQPESMPAIDYRNMDPIRQVAVMVH